MNRLKKLLLACAIVPLSHIALQPAARAEEGDFLLAQAEQPACQPGDPNCVPPEQVAPKQPEALSAASAMAVLGSLTQEQKLALLKDMMK